MRANLKFIGETFRKYNTICFAGKLPEIRIEITDAERQLGGFCYPVRTASTKTGRRLQTVECSMKLSRRFDMEQTLLEDVIIHEMIHFFIWYEGYEDTSAHGKLFKALMNEINSRFGRNITVRHKDTASLYDGDRKIKRHYFCVVKWNDGKWTLTQSASTKVFEIDDYFESRPDIVEKTWYFNTDPWMNRFPTSRSVKCYKITAEDIRENIIGRGALRMKRLAGRFVLE